MIQFTRRPVNLIKLDSGWWVDDDEYFVQLLSSSVSYSFSLATIIPIFTNCL